MLTPEPARRRTAWITGARGFIGRHLAATLSAAGWIIAGVGHGVWPAEDRATWGLAHWTSGEIDARGLDELTGYGAVPDVVFHLAGGASVAQASAAPYADFERSVASTAALLDWARRQQVAPRIVLASSAAVYGDQHASAIGETDPVAPVSIYGEHKAMMERMGAYYQREFGLRVVVARLFSVYGPYLAKQLIWDICCRIDAGETPLVLSGTGDELRDFIAVADAARALAGLADGTPVAPVNIGTGRAVRIADLAARVAANWSPPPPIAFSNVTRPGDPFSLVANVARLAATGFVPETTLERGLAETVTWFRQTPPADRARG